jgi:arginine exporter protein ArgO
MIPPTAAQSLFVLNQGLLVSFTHLFVGISTVCLCDTFLLLIVLGVGEAPAFLAALGYREFLNATGSVVLFVLGLLALRVWRRACSHPSDAFDSTRATSAPWD